MSKTKPSYYGLTFDLNLIPLRGKSFNAAAKAVVKITSVDISMIVPYEDLVDLKKRLDLLIIARETR